MRHNMIGLVGGGSMGTALGKLLVKAGYSIVAWNRTVEKLRVLENEGVLIASDIEALLKACDTIIVCVSDYAASDDIFGPLLGQGKLRGKTVVQLSTGTPKDAVDYAAKVLLEEVKYLDGAIMVTPSQMGTSEATILIAGDSDAFHKHENIFKILAPNIFYAGERVSHAAAWDLALLSYFFSALIGFAHAAVIARSEGIEVTELGAMIESWSPAVGAIMKDASAMIGSGNFAESESTVRTCAIACELVLRHAKQAGISLSYPQFAYDVFDRAMRNGLTYEDGVAIFKTL